MPFARRVRNSPRDPARVWQEPAHFLARPTSGLINSPPFSLESSWDSSVIRYNDFVVVTEDTYCHSYDCSIRIARSDINSNIFRVIKILRITYLNYIIKFYTSFFLYKLILFELGKIIYKYL